jgi:hypothetical protein
MSAPETISRVIADGGGLRDNAGKVQYELIPADALHALAEHYTKSGGPPGGPPKYPARNWERGMAWLKCFGCMMRHSWAWMRGEDFDADTGTHHMICVAWNAFAIFAYATRRIGTDDRPATALPAPAGPSLARRMEDADRAGSPVRAAQTVCLMCGRSRLDAAGNCVCVAATAASHGTPPDAHPAIVGTCADCLQSVAPGSPPCRMPRCPQRASDSGFGAGTVMACATCLKTITHDMPPCAFADCLRGCEADRLVPRAARSARIGGDDAAGDCT